MAGREHQAQHIVADVLIDRRIGIGGRPFQLVRHLDGQFGFLAIEPGPAAELIDRAALGDGHEPGSRVIRDP